jgi:hypothetical protein
LRQGPQGAEAPNPLYREVLVRELSYDMQSSARLPSRAWTTPDGRLDLAGLLHAFRTWWRAHADVLGTQAPGYPEAVPHLALCVFLQRVVKRVRAHDGLDTIVAEGLDQLGAYLDTLGLDHGWLVVFDVRLGRTGDERLWEREVSHGGRRLTMLGA